jgi:hypothetical protein
VTKGKRKYDTSPIDGKSKRQARNRRYYKADPDKWRTKSKKFRNIRRWECLTAYGGSPPRCQCKCGCAESRFQILEIHHLEEDGAEHRKLIGGSGALIFWLKKMGFPPGFVVLCPSCHVAITRIGHCAGDQSK